MIPGLKGKITGMAFRVPTADVSVVDLTAKLSTDCTMEQINDEIRLRASTDMKGFLGFTDEPLVSQDFVGNSISCTFDSKVLHALTALYHVVVLLMTNMWIYRPA